MSHDKRASKNERMHQRKADNSMEIRAGENERKRQRSAQRSPETRASENERMRKIEATKVAGLTPQARSAELKSKAEKEVLRRSGMSRREHE